MGSKKALQSGVVKCVIPLFRDSLLTCTLIMLCVGISGGYFSNGLLEAQAIRIYVLIILLTPIHTLLLRFMNRFIKRYL